MGAYDLILLDDVKAYMHLSAGDLEEDALSIYHDGTGDPTTATVAVASNTLTLDVDGTPTDYDLTAAARDTLTELVTELDALAGWVCNLLGPAALPSVNLTSLGAVSALGGNLTQTLGAENTLTLSLLIAAATARIETISGRKFLSRAYSNERYSGHGTHRLLFEQWPLTVLSSIHTGTYDALAIGNTDTTLLKKIVTLDDTNLTLDTVDDAGTPVQVELTLASYANTKDLAAAIAATGSWTATAHAKVLTTELIVGGPWSCIDQNVILKSIAYPAANYHADEDNGIVFLDQGGKFSKGSGNIFVSYTGGYATAPADIQALALDLVARAYQASQKNASLESETLGKYSYKTAGADVGGVPLSAEQNRLLASYRRLRVL